MADAARASGPVHKVAVDAMGGDHAPRAVVEGAAMAVARGKVRAEQLLLAGRGADLAPLLAEFDLRGVELVEAPSVVGMDESPASAIRGKPDSSIVLGMAAVADKRAHAFVSAGNTGAVVAASSLVLGRLAGVKRPGIAAPIPTRSGPCVVIDVGANIFCKPLHLVQYAILAAEYHRAAFGTAEPRVGLLNIGEEEGKGNPLIQETHALLQAESLGYRGFVEGQDLTSGAVDVVVCEGFVGNVILKVAEGLAGYVGEQVRAAFAQHPPRPEVGQAVRRAFEKLDYSEYGGAPLLGVAAPVLIGHGRSSAHAIMNMIGAAVAVVSHDVTERMLRRIEQQAAREPVT